jgi:hypothetical protein
MDSHESPDAAQADSASEFHKSLCCCYLPCKMYMVKNGNNVVEKGIKHGLPYYECSICRMPFTLSKVINLENNATGIIGSLVYNSIFALAIIFFIKISVVFKLFLLCVPVTFLIIAGMKYYKIRHLINLCRDKRAALLTSEQTSGLEEKIRDAREKLLMGVKP